MPRSKLLPGIIFSLLSIVVGFVTGASVAGLVVGRESGLAGGATVFMYGVVGCVAALIIAIVLSRKLTYQRLRVALIVAVLLAAAAFGWLAYRISNTT